MSQPAPEAGDGAEGPLFGLGPGPTSPSPSPPSAAPSADPGADRAVPHPDGRPDSATAGGAAPEPRRRRVVLAGFVAMSLVATAGAAYLAREGYRTAREITGDGAIDAEIAADQPGYIATVSPTPVHLLVLSNAEGAVDFLVVAESPGGAGARGLWIVGDLIIARAAGPMALEGITDLEGIEAGVAAVEELLGVGVADTTLVDPAAAEAMFSAVGTIVIDNPDTLSFRPDRGERVVYRAGSVELAPGEVDDFLLGTANRELPTNRFTRASLVFEEYFARLVDLDVAPTSEVRSDAGDDIVTRFAELAGSGVTFDLLAVTDQPYGDTVLYFPEAEAIASQVADAVAFPVSAFPGQRPRAYVLNGTADLAVATARAREVAAAGAEVVAVGNATTLDVAATTVEYHDPSFEAAAAAIGAVFGVDPLPSAQQTDARDVTVTLGPDASTR